MYKGLSLDVIRFEAQDVVTASAACCCHQVRMGSHLCWGHYDANGNPCTANEHNHTCDNYCVTNP